MRDMGKSPATMSSGLSLKLPVMLLILIIITTSDLGRSQDYLNPHHCMSTGNYAPNTTYSANLHAVLSWLSTNLTDTGFSSSSVGQGQDKANAVALCRGDVLLEECRGCVENAAAELLQICPGRKQAIRWYELCMLHYSNLPLRGIQTNGAGELQNTASVQNPTQFRAERDALLGALRQRAANGSSELKAGAGSRNTLGADTLYGMVQCVPTLSPEECNICLAQAGQGLPRSAQGARALRPSCNLRYELYLFYNEKRLRQLNALVVPEVLESLPAGSSKDNMVTIAVVVSISMCVILIGASAAIFLRKKKSVKEILGREDSLNKEVSLNLMS